MIKTGNYLLLVTFMFGLSQPVSAQKKSENCEESGYFESASSGAEAMQFLLGACFEDNEKYTEALAWYRKAAEQGGPIAQQSLGLMYFYGKGVPQNYAEAMTWIRKAAEQGFAEAQYNLANMYNSGKGVPQSHIEAFIWYRKAAERGFTGAFNVLAAYYAAGLGAPQSYNKCYTWSSLGAIAGNDDAVKLRDSCAEELAPESLQSAQKEAAKLFELYR